jgi:carbon-monoxide dehydrogenase large subunit
VASVTAELRDAGRIGASALRIEDGRLLSGRSLYVNDVTLPRMVHIAFVRAWPAHALLRSIDVSAALAMPAVVAALTAADLPDAGVTDSNLITNLAKTRQPAIARDRVRFAGEVVAIVVAKDRYEAEDAAEVVQVDYNVLPAVTEAGSPRPPGHVPIFDELPDDAIYDKGETFGDPSAAFDAAAHVVENDFDSGRSNASPLETRGCVASYDPSSNNLEFWASTQGPHLLRRKLAMTTGVPEHRIKVRTHDVGGAFGQKIPIHAEEILVALVAIRLGRPVKWIEDRHENLVAAPHARGQRVKLLLAFDAEGRMLGLRGRLLADAGAYSHNSTSALIESYLTARTLPGPYRIENYEYRLRCELTNKSPIAPYRGVGFVTAQVARELLIDEAARRIGIDRLELRRKNLIRRDEFPYTSATGLVFDSGSYIESLDRVADMAGYDEFLTLQSESRKTSRYLGLGISPHVEPTGWGTEGTNQVAWHSFPSNDSARVSLDQSGKATVMVGTTSQGQGIETVVAQVVADVIGLPLTDVRVDSTDTSSTPISLAGTRASRSAVVAGGAVGLAATEMREKILRVAGEILEADPADLEIAGGVVSIKGSPGRSKSVADVVSAAFTTAAFRRVDPEPNFTATRFYDPGASYANASIGAVVEVDTLTGVVRVLRLLAVEDCGTIINPTIVEGQLAGGMAQGLGGALLERIDYGPEGQNLTGTLIDYLLPTSMEVPDMEIDHLVSPSPSTWRGIKGVGESGAIGAPAAIALAVADALAPFGARVSRFPMIPETVMAMIDGARTQVSSR